MEEKMTNKIWQDKFVDWFKINIFLLSILSLFLVYCIQEYRNKRPDKVKLDNTKKICLEVAIRKHEVVEAYHLRDKEEIRVKVVAFRNALYELENMKLTTDDCFNVLGDRYYEI
jgi:hypothetical protein